MNLTVLSVVVGVILSNLRFAATNCGDLVNTFGHQLEELSGCVVNFTQSAGVCVNCIDEYLQFQSAYREFHLEANSSSDCRKTVKLHVDSLFNSFQDIWIGSQCPECYEPSTTDDAKVVPNLNKKTKEFFVISSNFTECLTQHFNSSARANLSVCHLCAPVFHELNVFYESHRIDGSIAICQDLQQLMNDSRTLWKDKFDCTQPEKTPVGLVQYSALSILLVFITVGFYVGSFVQGQRRIRKLKKYKTGSEISDDQRHLVRNRTGAARSTLG